VRGGCAFLGSVVLGLLAAPPIRFPRTSPPAAKPQGWHPLALVTFGCNNKTTAWIRFSGYSSLSASHSAAKLPGTPSAAC